MNKIISFCEHSFRKSQKTNCIAIFIVITMSLFASGCATYITRFADNSPAREEPISQIYPATLLDGFFMITPLVPIFHTPENSEEKAYQGLYYILGPFLMVGGAVDAPFAIVSDTIMLPWDIHSWIEKPDLPKEKVSPSVSHDKESISELKQ